MDQMLDQRQTVMLDQRQTMNWNKQCGFMGRIPDIASEFFFMSGNKSMEAVDNYRQRLLDSVVHALRLMHCEKLEPAFVKRYRADIVTSPAVRKIFMAS